MKKLPRKLGKETATLKAIPEGYETRDEEGFLIMSDTLACATKDDLARIRKYVVRRTIQRGYQVRY